jgi:hypothetical protein
MAIPATTKKKRWVCRIGDAEQVLEDVPLDVYIEIEAATKVDYFQLCYAGPAHNPVAATMLITRIAKMHGVPTPKVFTPRLMLECFSLEAADGGDGEGKAPADPPSPES